MNNTEEKTARESLACSTMRFLADDRYQKWSATHNDHGDLVVCVKDYWGHVAEVYIDGRDLEKVFIRGLPSIDNIPSGYNGLVVAEGTAKPFRVSEYGMDVLREILELCRRMINQADKKKRATAKIDGSTP